MVNSWEFVHVDYLDVETMDGHQCDGGWFSVNHHLLCLIGVYVQVAEFIPDDEVGDDLPILQVVLYTSWQTAWTVKCPCSHLTVNPC